MDRKPWAAEVADLEPMDEEAEAWALLARCPVDAADRRALGLEVAGMLRQLRERAGVSQVKLAQASETLHHTLISCWERGEQLHILQLHAGQLCVVLGVKVFDLVLAVERARGFGPDLEDRVIAAINAYLQEPIDARAAARTAGDLDEVEKLEDRLGKLPSIEELAQRLGIETPLSAADAAALHRAIVVTGQRNGWTLGREANVQQA